MKELRQAPAALLFFTFQLVTFGIYRRLDLVHWGLRA